MSQPIIEIRGLTKRFEGADTVLALENIDLTVETGQIYGIIGLSGAGKSTLVRCINLLEKPTEGTVKVEGRELTALSEKELRTVRKSIGMIFQHFNLLMQRTCLQNITFPLELVGTPKKEAQQRARELLKIVDLESKADAYPVQLSGGQKQRVAIARTLATDRSSFCVTRPPRPWTPRPPGTSCGSSRTSTAAWASPWSSSPTT